MIFNMRKIEKVHGLFVWVGMQILLEDVNL